MKQLVFVDDDKEELEAFRKIVQEEYQCRTVSWPPGKPRKEVFTEPPDLYVLDLYLPPDTHEANGSSTNQKIYLDDLIKQQAFAKAIAQSFSKLGADYLDYEDGPKKLLQDTMRCISKARNLLDMQWRALGQNPENGIGLLSFLKNHHKGVPVVFYSRKITPYDVLRALQEGAVDAIQKGFLKDHDLLRRLGEALRDRPRREIQITSFAMGAETS